MIIKSIRIEKLAYQGECRRLLLGGLPWANVVRSTKGDWRTCAEKEYLSIAHELSCADAHNRTGNSIHGGGRTPTRNHDLKNQFMTRSVKSSGIAAMSQIQPKRHNAWIYASVKSDTFSKLFKNKSPLAQTERGFVLYHRDKL